MIETKMRLEDWLDDLSARFIINLPREELEDVERICFQIEEAQWFYEDFIRPLDPALPSLNLKTFAMRMFQHCPLTSQWSSYHHDAAFSRFLAYKIRVPVRGAILLNEDMDEVVLVKGWKKGANWSFPRGKINRNEKDLDCAIREVYEETGFDVREADLIKDEDNVMSIEIAMREQHMRLYVFTGVPRDTYFEPRTRKEISKIEWYKLNELPTLKKSKHFDEGLAVANANKFYMVAPFLRPLKKWIAEQKKTDFKAQAGSKPPHQIDVEGCASVDKPLPGPNGHVPLPSTTEMPISSDLPEVNLGQDASSHLKQILRIGDTATSTAPNQILGLESTQPAAVDQNKSNALLALLRQGSQDAVPQVRTQSMPQSGNSQSAPILFPGFPPQPHQNMPFQPVPSPLAQPPINPPQQPHYYAFGQPDMSGSPGTQQHPHMPTSDYNGQIGVVPPKHALAPFQQTGDPVLSHSAQPAAGQRLAAPHASKLPPPKLTSHSLSLLNFFKDESSKTPVETNAVPVSADPGLVPTQTSQRQKTSHHQDNLLGLFKGQKTVPASQPAELSAHPVPQAQSPYEKHILQRAQNPMNYDLQRGNESLKIQNGPGRASATVSGPLNTPKFEANGKPTLKKAANSPARKNNMDRRPQPQQLSSPITILPRPQSAKNDSFPSGLTKDTTHVQAQTPSSHAARVQTPESAKPFQPQILRRSEKAGYDQSMIAANKPNDIDRKLSLPGLQKNTDELSPQTNFGRRPSQNAAQKEALLSLFGKPAVSPTPPSAEHPDSRTVTQQAAHASGLVSPLSSMHPNASSGESISRHGTPSEGDNISGANQLSSPNHKALLLGYLQGVAKGNKRT
ncbi:hypothetical protein N7532_005513 [Penicillium argentinense]|uniref:Nudix hydrolase domain-containing protein n=1 Tax=Penicillium argentinense TaxID=1131581 RepID=A0A9W9FEM3_9EURO|nr:uncharacterized protein N7532_005513 [Penicillium argentinense]KAJ5098512.1 hypothetical protein N7532_005513 [Penicillium argentinense]